MKKTTPFTIYEHDINELLVKANNIFVKLKETHPSEKKDWCDGIHKLQSLLGDRVLRREYPDIFYSSEQLLERNENEKDRCNSREH